MGSGKVMKRALAKYGEENFRKEWIMFCEDKDELDYMERVFVDETWISRSDTYNLKIGGEGGFTEEARLKGQLKAAEVHRGVPAWNSGKTGVYSEETIEKMRNGNLGQTPWNKGKQGCFSIETISKMRKPKTDAHKAALSAAKKGIPVPIRWKAVLQLTKDGTCIKEYASVKAATSSTGIRHIGDVCRGERPLAGGYIWRFKEQQSNNEVD